MKVDREVVKLLINAIEEDARTSSSSIYTFDYFCKKYGLYHESDKHRNGEVIINCVFHKDSDPSLSINEEKRIWHCLGCNSGGNYLDFIYQYEIQIIGNEISFYHFLNKLLKEDKKLQYKIQRNTIFSKEIVTAEDLGTIEKFKYKRGSNIPSNFLELSSLMLKKKCSKREIELAILAMQSGLPIEIIYKQIFKDAADESLLSADSPKYDLNGADFKDDE